MVTLMLRSSKDTLPIIIIIALRQYIEGGSTKSQDVHSMYIPYDDNLHFHTSNPTTLRVLPVSTYLFLSSLVTSLICVLPKPESCAPNQSYTKTTFQLKHHVIHLLYQIKEKLSTTFYH